jgi:hypothetical protein
MSFSTIQIKYSIVTDRPESLAVGELAYSQSLETLWIGYADGTVQEIGGKAFINQLGGLEATVQAIEESISSSGNLSQSIDALRAHIDGIDGQLATLATSDNLQVVQAAVDELSNRVSSVEQEAADALSVETGERADADLALGDRIDQAIQKAETELDEAVAVLDGQINTLSQDTETQILGLQSKDTAIEQSLANIEQEAADALATAVGALNDQVSAEASARQAADVGLQGAIDNAVAELQDAIDTETAVRVAANQAIGEALTTTQQAVSAAIDTERDARVAADLELSQRIDGLDTSLGGNGDVTFAKVTIAGDLIVQGTTTTVESEVVTIKDPVITLAEGVEVADGLDRGVEYKYIGGTGVASSGFFGVDTTDNKFKFIPEATVVGNKFTGAVGTLVADVEGNSTTSSRLEAPVDIALSGEVSGVVSFDGSANATISVGVDAVHEAVPTKLVRRDAQGGVKFAGVEATSVTAAQKSTFKGGIDGAKDDGSFSNVTGMIISGGTF